MDNLKRLRLNGRFNDFGPLMAEGIVEYDPLPILWSIGLGDPSRVPPPFVLKRRDAASLERLLPRSSDDQLKSIKTLIQLSKED